MKHTLKPEAMLQVGVKALAFNKEGKMLIMKRNPEKYPTAGNMWDIPGGRIGSEGTLLENLSREIMEETGLKAKALKILGAQDIVKPGIRVVRLTYISRVTSTKIKLSEEHTEYKWVKVGEALKIKGFDPYARKLIKDSLKDIVITIK